MTYFCKLSVFKSRYLEDSVKRKLETIGLLQLKTYFIKLHAIFMNQQLSNQCFHDHFSSNLQNSLSNISGINDRKNAHKNCSGPH